MTTAQDGAQTERGSRMSLGEVLLRERVLTQEQLDQATRAQQDSTPRRGLAPIVVELGLASEEQIVQAVAAHAGRRYVDPVAQEPDPSAVMLIDGALARRHMLIPVGYDGDRLIVGMRDPNVEEAVEEVAMVTGLEVEAAYAPRRSIAAAIDRAYPADEPVARPVDEPRAPAPQTVPAPASSEPVRVGKRLGMEEDEVSLDVHELLEQVLLRGASDLHLTAGVPPVIRLHGDLRHMEEYGELTPNVLQKLTYGMLSQRQRERLENDLDLDFSYSVPGVARFRGNIFIQRSSLGAVFRLIPFSVKPVDELGLPRQVAEFAKLPRGLVLVTGPTGSGKSTSLAAVIDLINESRPVHIMTVEDPIEFLHNHKKALVNQREVGEDVLGFANALKHVLRQDPDVILVGEMRDLETIQMAITAAETGHLVFATLHTQDAPQTIDRVIDVFPPHQQQQIRVQLAGSLQGVVAQQLIQTTDGRGRVAACEVLIATSGVRNLIREGKTHQIYSMMQAGAQHGMQTMDAALADLVRVGKISYKDALERSHNVEEFNSLVGRTGVVGAAAGPKPRVLS